VTSPPANHSADLLSVPMWEDDSSREALVASQVRQLKLARETRACVVIRTLLTC